MPIPVNLKETPAQLFKRLQQADDNLNGQNISKTMSFGFSPSTEIKNLLEPGPVNIGGIEWDFEWNNGIRSLVRQGFYKIIGTPFVRDIIDLETGEKIPTWSSEVIYCPHHSHHHLYFRFLANIGPMLNVEAIGYDFRADDFKMVTSKAYPDKAAFFKKMLNKVFYVSQQQYVNGRSKQTVWFVFK
ncbi:hypothetical protein ACTJKC_02715 [Pedobacter sp. 22226]|uniref:hypothetical protein n=1 Tax=Pedobacter sp. 22226 TaxID=3453894 RepID=UPI003F82C701